MRWIWTWWRRHRAADEQAAAARREAERKLREVEHMGAEVRKVAGVLADHLERNNFAELFAAALERRR